MPYGEHAPRQRLFGFEAQMSAFCSVAVQAGYAVSCLPFPEVFSTDLSVRLGLGLEPAAGLPRLPPHVRFGPATHTRLLKGSCNLVVAGEQDLHPPVVTGRHPFASSRRLPAGVSGVLRFDAALDEVASVSGEPIPQALLPGLFCHGDLLERDEPRSPTDRQWLAQSGLQVQSCRELDPAAWSDAGALEPAAPSDDFGQWLAARRSPGDEAAGSPGAVLVPWNLAYPGSIVPDLVGKLAKFSNAAALSVAVVLLPFNEPAVSGKGRALAFEQLRASLARGDDVVGNVFVARLRDLAWARALAGLFDAAWIDGNDPEWLWSARRLAFLGVPGVLLGIGTESEDQPAADLNLRRIPADDVLDVWDSSGFGRRLYRPGSLSVREVHRLCGSVPRVPRPLGARRRPSRPQQRKAAQAAFEIAVEPFLRWPRIGG